MVAAGEKPKVPMPPAEAKDLTAGALAQLILSAKSKPFAEWLVDLFMAVAKPVIAFALEILGGIATRLATILLQLKDQGDPAYNALAEVAIKDLCDVDVRIGSTNAASAAVAHAQAVRNIGEGVLHGLFGQWTGGTPESLKPSDAGAANFMNRMVRLSFEGWLVGWLVEMLGVGQLEKFGEFDDKLAATLGLGRLSRRVLAPPLSILIEQPFTWLLNKTYRPGRLGSADAIRQYLRGRWTREQLFDELALQGLRDPDIEALLTTHQKFLSVEDLGYLVAGMKWTTEQAIQHLQDSGYSEQLATLEMTLESNRRLDPIRKQMMTEALASYERDDIKRIRCQEILEKAGILTAEREMYLLLGDLRRELRTNDLSLRDVEQGVKRGILTIADFRAACFKQGYSLKDARTLELLLMTDITTETEARTAKERLAIERQREKDRKAQEQAARRAEIEAEQKVRGVSLAQFEAMVRAGLRSIEQYREFLAALKYAPADVSALAELLEGQIDQARADAERREELEAEARKRKISLGDLERAVKLGVMSVDEYRSQLAAAGFGDEDRQLLAAMLQRELDLARENEERRAAAQAALAVRKISLEDLERAVRLGRRSVDQYRARLLAEGLGADDADLMADLLRAALKADQEARERRAEIDARLAKKKIPLSDMETAVRAGVRTMADYRALLVREGYSDADAELLERLLQLQLDADKAAAETRKAAEARLAERRISLSDVERAVKLGVMDLAGYKRVLTREGFTPEDQGILLGTLTAELAAIRAAERKRAEAEKAAAKRQISLSDLERAVRVGVRSAVEYQGALASLGYSAQDQATLMALLQLQLQQDQAARAKREAAETALVQRGLSLSQFERAVLEGVRPMAEYRAWLGQQGYATEDVATLAALLQLEIAERAAREQGVTA